MVNHHLNLGTVVTGTIGWLIVGFYSGFYRV